MEDRDSPRQAKEEPGRPASVEKLYERFRGVPLPYLDIFIAVCVIALVGVVAAGILHARGIL